ncbi:MAG TPA: hypothetical protein VE592_08725 [Geminicoccaceae bacterium]|nr:hypothetical protein [Geminicoccaceae bacterium]
MKSTVIPPPAQVAPSGDRQACRQRARALGRQAVGELRERTFIRHA